MNDKVPLGLKILWVNHAISLAVMIMMALDNPMPISFGPWEMPMFVSHFYIAFMIMANILIVFRLMLLDPKGWWMIMLLHAISLLNIIFSFFINQDVLNARVTQVNTMISLDQFRWLLSFVFLLEVVIVSYLLRVRSLFFPSSSDSLNEQTPAS